MFAHLFSYRIRCFLRDKPAIFWTVAFPLLLATLFKLAFANLQVGAPFSTIPIAVVDNATYQNNHTFQKALQSAALSHDGATPLFNVQETTVQEAEQLLESGTISGYILLDPSLQMIVKHSGLNQSILKSFLDYYVQTSSSVASIMQSNPSALQDGFMNDLLNPKTYLLEVSVSRHQPHPAVVLFYALLAMASLFGALWGVRIVHDTQADQSFQGARVNLAPVHKLKLFGADVLAVLLIQFTELLILLCYMGLVLKVPFGYQLGYIVLVCLVGSLVGIAMGTFIGAVVKGGEGAKIGVVIASTLLMCLFAGLYFADIKYMVVKAFPLAAYINPANLIADAFYALYYFDTFTRFSLNVGLLLAFSVVFFFGAYLALRRNQYASIPSLLQNN